MGFYVTRKCGHRQLVTGPVSKEFAEKVAKRGVCRSCKLKTLKKISDERRK